MSGFAITTGSIAVAGRGIEKRPASAGGSERNLKALAVGGRRKRQLPVALPALEARSMTSFAGGLAPGGAGESATPTSIRAGISL